MKLKKLLLFFSLVVGAGTLGAQPRMPAIFSDNMVLQRDRPVNVWGWADAGEKIEVEFNDARVTTRAGRDGRWSVELPPCPYGGPYTMLIKARSGTVGYDNILVGDVWLCSGQSNMEWTVGSSADAAAEISAADYFRIRHFKVARDVSASPREDVEGQWVVCSPETVGDFTAVGYFFGREIHNETDIPIGLINSSWGGTDIEPWTSASMMETVPEFSDKMEELRSGAIGDAIRDNKSKKQQFVSAMDNDPGLAGNWQDRPEVFTSKMAVPRSWHLTPLADMDGIVWYRYEFTLPGSAAGKEARLSLGQIDDADITYINGHKVGETAVYTAFRNYDIPEGVLRGGKNTIVVRVKDYSGNGGFTDPAENLYIQVGDEKYPLAGEWDYAISVDSRSFGYREISPNSLPTLLYNAMIAPIIDYPIKGAIWYQGENNASRARQYQTLFPNMINDWRDKWGYDFPFYWVQLANFMSPDEEPPVRSEWAELREAQTMTLSVPSTGQAVIIDIGEADDIHPRNKQDVGRRLALHALGKDYGVSGIQCESPSYKTMSVDGSRITVEFDNVGSGLVARNRYGYVNGFAVAGADGKFHWAKAYIAAPDRVVVECDRVPAPVAVRYGWGNNPDDVNLYNAEGLPACPFRADE